ncbi:stimulator of interferon genes protein-like [Amphibalanus amphitrite]|uniref:stimulator of interferon genes protein-like n=1 Tax=Amphibalanus amphitrite TaxID=1232801 RepID=UPI001C90B508|nr:stimulator of interferon genes protein-like [Amphibalanus amphitrite]
MPSTEESCGSLMSKRCFWPGAVAVPVYAIWSFNYGLWLAFTQVCLCGLCLTGARLLVSTGARLLVSKGGEWKVWQCLGLPTGAGSHGLQELDKHTFLALLGIVIVQLVVSSEVLWLMLSHWFLVLIAPILAVTLNYVGTPKVLLEEVLESSQISYAQGAAWAFYMGYLTKTLDYDNRSEASFKERMNDYLTSNELQDDTRAYTSKNRMLIVVPMKREALLSDRGLTDHDRHGLLTPEKKLEGIEDHGRKFGETQVYRIEEGGKTYRVAMEEATPIRTAAHAVDDATAKFEAAEFEEFAKRFMSQLEAILATKQAVGNQIKLVPIYDVNEVRSKVLECLKKLEKDEAEEAAHASEQSETRS